MRADEGRPVPDLLLGGLDQPAGESISRDFPGQGRCVRGVGQAQTGVASLLGRDLGVGGSDLIGKLLEQSQSRCHDRSAGLQ